LLDELSPVDHDEQVFVDLRRIAEHHECPTHDGYGTACGLSAGYLRVNGPVTVVLNTTTVSQHVIVVHISAEGAGRIISKDATVQRLAVERRDRHRRRTRIPGAIDTSHRHRLTHRLRRVHDLIFMWRRPERGWISG